MKKLENIIEQVYQVFELSEQTFMHEIPSYYATPEQEAEPYDDFSIDLGGIAHLLEQSSVEFEGDISTQEHISILVEKLKEKESTLLEEIKKNTKARKKAQDELADLTIEGHALIEELKHEDKDRFRFTSVRSKHFNNDEISILQASLKDLGIVFLEKTERFIFMKTQENESKTSLELLISKVEENGDIGRSISKKLKSKAQSSMISLYAKNSVEIYFRTFIA